MLINYFPIFFFFEHEHLHASSFRERSVSRAQDTQVLARLMCDELNRNDLILPSHVPLFSA